MTLGQFPNDVRSFLIDNQRPPTKKKANINLKNGGAKNDFIFSKIGIERKSTNLNILFWFGYYWVSTECIDVLSDTLNHWNKTSINVETQNESSSWGR